MLLIVENEATSNRCFWSVQLSGGTAEKTINTVFSAEHDYLQYKKIKIRHFLQ